MPVPDGFYTVPAMGRFGAPRPASGSRHRGLDQYAPEGTASGLEQAATILAKGSNLDPRRGYGHWVRYRHDDGHELLEAHLMAPSPLVVGRRYEADTLVGRVGDTGNAVRVGPHVHVEVRKPNGLLVDPARYLATLQPADVPPDPPTLTEKDTDMRIIRVPGGSIALIGGVQPAHEFTNYTTQRFTIEALTAVWGERLVTPDQYTTLVNFQNRRAAEHLAALKAAA